MTPPAGRTAAALLAAAVLASMAPTAGQEPDRSAPPKVGPPPELRLPPIGRHALSNGIPVWLIPRHEVPVAQVALVVERGAAADPADKLGLASLTAAMLDEGAGGLDALALADRIDFLGASLSTSAGFEASSVRLYVPVARLKPALELMADVVRSPAFPASELERLRRERLTALLQARDDAGAIASTGFQQVVYGPAHRYGAAVAGTPATLEALSLDDLRAFYAAAFRPEHATLIVVGDLTWEQASPALEAAFGSWRAAGPPPAAVTLPAAAPPASRAVYLVDKPDAAQSEIRIGSVGAARSTPDYFPLVVLNTVLGGAFSSRLNQNLREEHGYAYGAGSRFDMRKWPGPFVAAAAVQTDKTAEALAEFFNELDAIRDPVPDEELSRARNYLALGYPGDFETISRVAGKIEEMILYDLPDDYFSTFIDRVQAVSASDAQKVAREYITPERFVVFVVGDLKAIEQPVRALNLGPVKILSIDDVMGKPR